VVLIGQKRAVVIAVINNKESYRYSKLKEWFMSAQHSRKVDKLMKAYYTRVLTLL